MEMNLIANTGYQPAIGMSDCALDVNRTRFTGAPAGLVGRYHGDASKPSLGSSHLLT